MGRENRYTNISNNRTNAGGRSGCGSKSVLRCGHSLDGGGEALGRSGLGRRDLGFLTDIYGGVPAEANFQSS